MLSQIGPLVCRVWFFLAFKEQILGLINASTAAHAPDEVLSSTILYNITITGSGSVSVNCDDTEHVNVHDLSFIILSMHKLATCKAGMHNIFLNVLKMQSP